MISTRLKSRAVKLTFLNLAKFLEMPFDDVVNIPSSLDSTNVERAVLSKKRAHSSLFTESAPSEMTLKESHVDEPYHLCNQRASPSQRHLALNPVTCAKAAVNDARTRNPFLSGSICANPPATVNQKADITQ